MRHIVLIAMALLASSILYASEVKEADLAGSWYPASREELSILLRSCIDKADPEKIDGRILAVISPHAGYQFSAPVAAYGYKSAESRSVKTVIVIGFSHRKQFEGISVNDRGQLRTPLGDVRVDERLARDMESLSKRIFFYPQAFDGENSVEMQIPFIQLLFPEASVVSVAFGTQSYTDAVVLADALASLLKDREDCLLVASTDLSHYHPYEEAKAIDGRLIDDLKRMKAIGLYEDVMKGKSEACGLMPLTAVLLTAEKLGYDKIKILKTANSGDTFGDKSRVVGYASAVIYKGVKPAGENPKAQEEKSMLINSSQRKRLLEIARESIKSFVVAGKRKTFNESDPVLNEPMGAFVTLHENGELRGCIGNMVAQGPLYKTVANMAVEAATGDPRFPALSADEIDKIDLEISVLSPMKKIYNTDEIKIPGNGVLVRRGYSSGVYLPQVATETGWGKEEFMSSLCEHKAGLPAEAWKDPSTDIYIFSAEVFGEKEHSK